MDIGKRIKQLRIKNNLTLEELASRCELTKGFLSQLERNLTSPSIVTLEDICEALGITMSKFFEEENDEKIVFKQEDAFVDEKELSITNWIVPNAQKNEMEPIILQLKPQGTSQIIYPHEGEESGYVLSGKVTLYFEKSQKGLVIRKNEAFYINGDKQHYLKNDSNMEAKLLWICTPPIF